MNRIDRLFAIVTLLQSRKFTTGEAIATRFNLSIRTVFRDIKALGETGIPIGFEPGKGYYLVEGYFTPPVSFTLEEANSLVLSQSLVNGFLDRNSQESYDKAITKVKAVLSYTDKDKVNDLDKKIKLQLPKRLNPEFDYLALIQEMIVLKRQLKLRYTSLKQETEERIIEPIGIVFYAFSWHLIAYCHLRHDYRDFKLSRIDQLDATEHPFEIDPHIALNDYDLPVTY